MLAFSVLAVALTAATSTLAHPTVKLPRAAPGPWCNGLGAGAFDEAFNFTIGAYNATGTNTNSTGAPIVVNSAGAIDGASFWHLGTWAQYPYGLEYPSISLINGTLVIDGEGATPAQATSVDAGNSLEWVARNSAEPKAGAQIYCAVADTDPNGGGTGHPFLAVNGDTDSFSLCQTTFENVVYYKAAPDRGYDYDSCYPVKLQLIY
ncbi:hypothetical protein PYCCODRAFT_695093 [Trametes coccinea BRFM310]|uniref:Lytic polysaccharide monooxygenase n=1 Tax=Trametes coccinea (strain BRFM310) TaxID=1353009 RepID=A0A1Y2II61_TRAC3|nr:hypothetical protein PYCCODRAFT_695093 [Trametes coccinea BRFM310]